MANQFEFYTSKIPFQPIAAPPIPTETATSILGKTLSEVGAARLEKGIRVHKEIGLEKASQAGSIAGSQIGFVPRTERSEEDIAFNRAAMQAQKAVLQTEIRNTIMGFSQDELTDSNLNSVNRYNVRVKHYSANLLDQVSPALKPYAKNMIEYYGLTHKEPIVREVDALNRNLVNSNLQLSYNNNLRDATQAAFKGDQNAAVALRTNVKKHLDSALATGNITSSYHTNSIETFDKNIKFARYEGQFHKAIMDDNANTEFSNFIATSQKDLTPDEKQTLISRFNSMLLQHKQALIAQYGNIDNKVRDLNTAIFLNGTNAAVEGRIAKMKGLVDQYYFTNPDKAKELKDSIDFAVQRHNFRQSILYAPISEINSKVAQQEEILKGRPTFENAKNINTLSSDARSIIAQRKRDLYDIVAAHPSVIAATTAQRNSNQANVALNDGQQLGPATKNSIQDRDEMMLQVEKQMGISPADYEIVPPTDIQNLSTIMAENDPKASIAALQNILSQHVHHLNEAMNQIQKKIPGSNIMLFNGAFNPETQSRRSYMFNAAANKTSDLEQTLGATAIEGLKDQVRKNIMNNYGDAILNKNGDPTKILAESLDYAYKLAMMYQLNNIANPAETAVNDALKSHVKINSYNGRKYLIPNNPNYDTKDVNNATFTLLATLDPNKLRVPTSFRPGEPLQDRQQAYRIFLSNDAYPALTADNRGMILLDGRRQPVKLLDGTPDGANIGFTFKELMDKSNELHKSVHMVQAEEVKRLKAILLKPLQLLPGFLRSI